MHCGGPQHHQSEGMHRLIFPGLLGKSVDDILHLRSISEARVSI